MPPKSKIRILVADAQFLNGDALATSLSLNRDFEVFEERPNSAEAAIAAVKLWCPEIVLLDYWMEIEAPIMVRSILDSCPDSKVIIVSWFYGPDQIQMARDAGAVGFLPRTVSVERVTEAILRAQSGENPVFAKELGSLVSHIESTEEAAREVWTRLRRLTKREVSILGMLSSGKGARQISRELFISIATVRNHIHHALTKMGVHTRADAVAMAREYGIIPR